MKKHISKSLAAAFLSLFGLSSNVVGMENNPKPKVDYKITGIKHLNDKEDSIKLGGQAIIYSDPLILVINGLDQKRSNDFEAKSLVYLLCRNELGLKVSDIDKNIVESSYNEGRVYHIKDQNGKDNVRVTFFNVDHFNDKNFMLANYTDKGVNFITKNTNIVIYLFGKRNNGDCAQKLEKFYHRFNEWWCQGYYDYKKTYEPYGERRDNWFRSTLQKMGIDNANHRYMYFLYYGTNDECLKFIGCNCKNRRKDINGFYIDDHGPKCRQTVWDFVAAMPDGRSIVGDLFFENASIDSLKNEIFEYGHYQPYKLYSNQKVKGESKWFWQDETDGTGFEKKNIQSEKSWQGY